MVRLEFTTCNWLWGKVTLKSDKWTSLEIEHHRASQADHQEYHVPRLWGGSDWQVVGDGSGSRGTAHVGHLLWKK